MNSQRILVPKCAFIKYGLDIKGSFIAGSRKCYGKSRGYFWEYENSPDSDCAFQLDQNATHASYDVVMETQIKNSRHILDQTQVGFHLLRTEHGYEHVCKEGSHIRVIHLVSSWHTLK